MYGKRIRLSRILREGKMLCVPMDHGVSMGPIKGVDTIYDTIHRVETAGATAVIVHKGVIKGLREAPRLGLIAHLSASTSLSPYPNQKIICGCVEEAVMLGADAVSVHINMGHEDENAMLEDLGTVADEADRWGMPLLAMMYARGERIKDKFDPDVVAHIVRVAAELGADIVKTTYTGSPNSFRRVVECSPAPVVIAGGPKAESDREVLEMVAGAMEAGSIGVTFGRNVFQHENPSAIVRAIGSIIFEGRSVEEAMRVLSGGET